MTYLASGVTSDGEVIAVQFDSAQNVVSLAYLSGEGEHRGENICFPAEDITAICDLLDTAHEELKNDGQVD